MACSSKTRHGKEDQRRPSAPEPGQADDGLRKYAMTRAVQCIEDAPVAFANDGTERIEYAHA